MSLQVQSISYVHPDKEVLFNDISFSVSDGERCAIVGNNGVGKSTLLKIIAGILPPSSGQVACDMPYLVPQHFGQFDGMMVAEALGIAPKLKALANILDGNGTEEDFAMLDDDWSINESVAEAFGRWGIGHVAPGMPMSALSGGEKTKVFLAGMDIRHPAVTLMDEPTNHLDAEGRALLYEHIRRTNGTVVIVSHDRTLLNIVPAIYEMSQHGMQYYPMPYDEYKEVTDSLTAAKLTRLQSQQKELAKAEKAARKTMERQQKHASRGEKQSAKKGLARIVMGNLRDKSEASTSRLNKVQEEKLQAMSQEVKDIRASIPEQIAMRLTIGDSSKPGSKLLLKAADVTFSYDGGATLWQHSPLNLSVYSGERIRLQGCNGSGKSTLLKLVTGELQPTGGEMSRAEALKTVYLDQEYSCIANELTVYGQLESCATKRPEHELKMLLNRFLFTTETWEKRCGNLSGGEKMKLALCCLLAGDNAPDMIIADEPTNNIDIASMDILAATLRDYRGTLVVVSHDEEFVRDVGIEREINIG